MWCSSRDVKGPLQNSQGHIGSNLKSTIKENKSKAERRESAGSILGKKTAARREEFFFLRKHFRATRQRS